MRGTKNSRGKVALAVTNVTDQCRLLQRMYKEACYLEDTRGIQGRETAAPHSNRDGQGSELCARESRVGSPALTGGEGANEAKPAPRFAAIYARLAVT